MYPWWGRGEWHATAADTVRQRTSAATTFERCKRCGHSGHIHIHAYIHMLTHAYIYTYSYTCIHAFYVDAEVSTKLDLFSNGADVLVLVHCVTNTNQQIFSLPKSVASTLVTLAAFFRRPSIVVSWFYFEA